MNEELFGETPLHVAASAGQTNFTLEILRLKTSFGKKLNPEGLSPLHLALQNKYSETVRQLVKFDSELIRVKGREGLTPLHFVAKTDDPDDLSSEFLHVCSSSINDVTIHEETTLHIAVKSSSLKAIEVLLGWLQKTYKGEVLCLTDKGGNTVLHTTLSTSQPKACFHLFFGSINIIVVDRLLANTTVQWSVITIGIVKLLVKEIYMDKNAKNLEQLTALEIAATLPNDEAKNEIKNTLGHTGALKRSSLVSDLGEFLKSPRQWFQALIIIHENREMSMDMRNTILVVAVLIAIATFQAVLQPPGGVKNNYSTPSHNYSNGTITTTNFISTNITHFNATIFTNTNDNPAEIKLTNSITYGSFFINFFTLNTVCFLASITAMIFVLPL
ncbi:hypothetical protein ACSBR2_037700 [Camellia fascicularis]